MSDQAPAAESLEGAGRNESDLLYWINRLATEAAQAHNEVATMREAYVHAMERFAAGRNRRIERGLELAKELALRLHEQTGIKTFPLPCGSEAKVREGAPSVEILDQKAVPPGFMRQPPPPPPMPDKKKILSYYKQTGEVVEGASIVEPGLVASINLEKIELPTAQKKESA